MSVEIIKPACKECGSYSEFTITISSTLDWKDKDREDLELCSNCLVNYCKDIIDKIMIIRRI